MSFRPLSGMEFKRLADGSNIPKKEIAIDLGISSTTLCQWFKWAELPNYVSMGIRYYFENQKKREMVK